MPEARLQVMDLLLQGGADPSKADKYGATPVQVLQMTTDAAATTKGENETEMDTVVVAQNKNPKMSHHETMRHQLLTKLQPQRPPLLRAILEHNLTIVEYVLCGDDDNVNKQAVTNQLYQGQSPVDVVVEELLQTITIASDTTAVGKEDTEQNVNINKDDDSLLAILTTLIMYGADANGGNPNQSISEADKNAALLNNNTNSNSDPPLHRLVLKLRDCFKQQPERSSSPSAAIATLTSAVCALLEAGASTRSIETEQLLHQAARFNEQSLARFLLETLHIPVNARGRQGMTPLQFAARSGQVEMVVCMKV